MAAPVAHMKETLGHERLTGTNTYYSVATSGPPWTPTRYLDCGLGRTSHGANLGPD